MRNVSFILLVGLTAFAVSTTFTTLARAKSDPKDDKEEKAAAELKKLSGRWQINKATFVGRDFPFGPGSMQEFDGSIQKSFVVNKPGETIRIVTLDLSTDPKRMTLTEAELKNGLPTPKADGQVARIIYSLDGDKLTTIMWRGPKPEFPKSLDWKAGDPVMVLELKREKN